MTSDLKMSNIYPNTAWNRCRLQAINIGDSVNYELKAKKKRKKTPHDSELEPLFCLDVSPSQ